MDIEFDRDKVIKYINQRNDEMVASINVFKAPSQKRKRMYSVSHFAREHKLSKAHLNNILWGHCMPGLKMAFKLAAATGYEFNDLIIKK